MKFEELALPAALVEGLVARGFVEALPVQAAALPPILAGRDVLVRSDTGSGKTLAFGLPLVERTAPARAGRPTALVLVPTRELASQAASVLAPFVRARGLNVGAIFGGVPARRQTAPTSR